MFLADELWIGFMAIISNPSIEITKQYDDSVRWLTFYSSQKIIVKFSFISAFVTLVVA